MEDQDASHHQVNKRCETKDVTLKDDIFRFDRAGPTN